MNLHERLIAKQTEEELERKANKARRKDLIWTQEEIDAARRVAKRWRKLFVDEKDEDALL